ncbi:putative disease resistance protein RGA4 [Bienertia sinuspersici]
MLSWLGFDIVINMREGSGVVGEVVKGKVVGGGVWRKYSGGWLLVSVAVVVRWVMSELMVIGQGWWWCGVGICIAEKLLETIRSDLIKQICDMWGYKSQLNDLKETVTTIQKVLFDADARRELSHEGRDYIDSLKDAVYDADDLFDEFLTLAELKQLRPLSKRGKIYEKVRCFFSSDNQLGQAYRMSRDVKHIKKRLDDIADTHKKFGFSVDYKPIIRRREETCSYVDANKIIGREEDKEAIIEMLLDCNNEEICFTTIVGVGGLGKTALAQLVYDDKRINKEFHENHKFWVCVADQEGEQFDVKTILIKILELVTRCEKWRNLQEFLMLGQGGSRVMVTTRSTWTATIIDGKHVYNLEGLSSDNSWRLFEMSAFGKEIKGEYHADFVEIGKKIVVKCCSNPLALKVAGSLLFGQSISKWHFVEDSEWGKIKKDGKESLEDVAEEYFAILLRRCFFQDVVKNDYDNVESVKIHDLMHDVAQEVGREEVCVVTCIPNILGNKIRHLRYDGFDYIDDETAGNSKVEDNLSESGEVESQVLAKWASSLNILEIHRMSTFRRLFGEIGLHHFTALYRLNLGPLFYKNNTDEEDVFEGCSFPQNLRALHFMNLQKMTSLPQGMQYLTSLRHLCLGSCMNLKALPEWISCLTSLQTFVIRDCPALKSLPEAMAQLTSLQTLTIYGCPELQQRCKEPDGEDRPKIQHIRYIPGYWGLGKLKWSRTTSIVN